MRYHSVGTWLNCSWSIFTGTGIWLAGYIPSFTWACCSVSCLVGTSSPSCHLTGIYTSLTSL